MFQFGTSRSPLTCVTHRLLCVTQSRLLCVTRRFGGNFMIKLTRLDGEPFVLNAELIRYVERRPDTFVTLTSGDRIVVAETMDEVVQRAVQYQQRKHFMPMPRAAARAGQA